MPVLSATIFVFVATFSHGSTVATGRFRTGVQAGSDSKSRNTPEVYSDKPIAYSQAGPSVIAYDSAEQCRGRTSGASIHGVLPCAIVFV